MFPVFFPREGKSLSTCPVTHQRLEPPHTAQLSPRASDKPPQCLTPCCPCQDQPTARPTPPQNGGGAPPAPAAPAPWSPPAALTPAAQSQVRQLPVGQLMAEIHHPDGDVHLQEQPQRHPAPCARRQAAEPLPLQAAPAPQPQPQHTGLRAPRAPPPPGLASAQTWDVTGEVLPCYLQQQTSF